MRGAAVKWGSALIFVGLSGSLLVGCGGKVRTPADAPGIRAELEQFYSDPRTAMDRIPVKRDGEGRAVESAEPLFSEEEIRSGEFLRAKDENRAELMSRVSHAMVEGNIERVLQLVQVPRLYQSISEIESRGLLEVTLETIPWSDSYWPLQKGLVATRYSDRYYPNSKDWRTNYSYVESRPFISEIEAGRSDSLSPAEKYDYLVGDEGGALTDAIWDNLRSRGSVRGWEGICDGWSAASIFYPEPTKSVMVTSRFGKNIRFYPSDIKGLASLLWAKGRYPLTLIGTRCGLARPPRDEMGRITDPSCMGTNAGSWHLALVNQLGQARRPLVIDANLDYEIWNFPIWKYKTTYFNPQTLQPVSFYRDALTPLGHFTIDRFRKYRAPNTAYVVGASTTITYSIEVQPSHSQGRQLKTRQVSYLYDLELDSNLNIIGGEWYSNVHPDFMWAPAPGSQAMSTGDSRINREAWSGVGSPPEDWLAAARVASPNLQPLAAVVNRLVQLGSQ